MEEHLLDIQDVGGRGGFKQKPKSSKKFSQKKKPSRFSSSKPLKSKKVVPFVPTKRPPVRARRPKVLNKPSTQNSNLGQTLIPPESIKSGNSLVDDYADYEYIYFYDNYDQDQEDERARKEKLKQIISDWTLGRNQGCHRQEKICICSGFLVQLPSMYMIYNVHTM